MGGLLSTWKRMLWLIHHLNQKLTKLARSDDELLQARGYCKTDSTESCLAQYQTYREINNAAKLPQPLVYISTGADTEMAETHTASKNKDEEMTSDENLLLIADSTNQTILFTRILQPDQWIF